MHLRCNFISLGKLLLCLYLLCAPLVCSANNVVIQDTVIFKPVVDTAIQNIVTTPRKFEPGFKEKYSGSEFIYKNKSKAKTAGDRFLEWLIKFLDRFSVKDGKTGEVSGFGIVMRIVGGLLIAFLVFLVVAGIISKDGGWIFGRSRKKIGISEVTQEDITRMDFKQLIAETRNTGDNRLAVRYYYLWVLKKMSDREIIKWHWDKTNSDYMYEIKDSGLKNDFKYLSYVYDYSWYGDFPLDESAYAKAEKAFVKTLNTL